MKWKRVDLLIEAFARTLTQYPDAELVIVGNGPELDNLKKQATALGLPSAARKRTGLTGVAACASSAPFTTRRNWELT